ncbi:MAG: DsbA family protein, partial [Muribaculaceae bacterium]|nr:DsbA family protein [Muribaculaceae bacterium]
LMKLAENKYDRSVVARLNEALFKAYFVENLVLADHKVLLDKGLASGMSKEDINDVLNSDKYDDEVRFDEREAAMRGVRGVPYIVFGGEFSVPGAMSIDGFKSALERMIKREQENETSGERPHTCGPDGCQLL